MSNITQYTQSYQDTAALVNFGGKAKNDTFAVVNFVGYSKGNQDTSANVAFIVSSHFDKNAYVNFRYGGNQKDFSATVNFFQESGFEDFPATVNFYNDSDINANVTFIQNDEFLQESNVTFKLPVDNYANVTFFQIDNSDLPAHVFLGRFYQDLKSSVIFIRSDIADFQCSLIIQSNQVQELSSNYGDTVDFNCQMQVLGLGINDFPAYVNLRTPPFDIDLVSNVSFIQKTLSDFSVTMNIRNRYSGVGNSAVSISNEGNSEVSHSMLAKNSSSNTVFTDGTGYFSINNLSPGTYVVAPIIDGVACLPPSYTVTITNANVYLYFGVDIADINSVPTSPLAPINQQTNPVCYVSPDDSQPGTFSIEGFIKFYEGDYTNIMTIITSQQLVDGYLGTMNNYGF